MAGTSPARNLPLLAATAFTAATTLTFIVFAPFPVVLGGCEGFGCLGTMLFWPIAGAAALICAIAVALWGRRGWTGLAVTLLGATGGYIVANLVISALDLFPI